jgi:hypothetical protein
MRTVELVVLADWRCACDGAVRDREEVKVEVGRRFAVRRVRMP